MSDTTASDNVFIGDLPESVTNEQLQQIFAAYGTVVQCRVLPSKRPGGKASALVRFASVEEASWVVRNLNGNLAEGLDEPIVVRFANQPGQAGNQWGPTQSHGYDQSGYQQWGKQGAHLSPHGNSASDNIFVGDLPATITTEKVQAVFAAYGTVVSARALAPKGNKASALVRFASVEEAEWVVSNLNGNLAEGLEEPIVVRFANNNQANGGVGGGKGGFGNLGPRAEPYGGGAAWNSWGGKGACVGGSMRDLLIGVKKAGIVSDLQDRAQCQLYVKNLPADCSDADLFRLFAPFGSIAGSGVKAMLNDDGSCKGIGFVDFIEPAHAANAIANLNDFSYGQGSQLKVALKIPKNTQPPTAGAAGGGGAYTPNMLTPTNAYANA